MYLLYKQVGTKKLQNYQNEMWRENIKQLWHKQNIRSNFSDTKT
jgi:hypothetical protein